MEETKGILVCLDSSASNSKWSVVSSRLPSLLIPSASALPNIRSGTLMESVFLVRHPPPADLNPTVSFPDRWTMLVAPASPTSPTSLPLRLREPRGCIEKNMDYGTQIAFSGISANQCNCRIATLCCRYFIEVLLVL